MPTIRTRYHRLMIAPLAAALVAAAAGCGDTTSTSTAGTSPDTAPPSSAPAPDEGGFGPPAAVPGEFGELPEVAIVGTAEIDTRGCWYLSGNDETALLVAPTGSRAGDDGATLVTADGTVIESGERLDISGAVITTAELPGGADGRWGNYAAFCDPVSVFVVVADSIAPEFDPADVDPEALAAELDATVFDTDLGCGHGFTTGDAGGRWALRIDLTSAPPPGAGPVSLPDDRFHVSVTAGAHLFANHCDDVMEWFEPESVPAVDWDVTAGQFTYPGVEEDGCGGPPVTVTLVDATVDTPAGPVALGPVEITNTAFGCFAG